MELKRRRNRGVLRRVGEAIPCRAPTWLFPVLVVLLVTAGAATDTARVPVLSEAELSQWSTREFSGETRYTQVGIDGRRAVKAVSYSAASGLYREIAVDLHATPFLHWSWRVDRTFGQIDETTREGDDYPARVYVLSSHPIFFWKTRALAYVWSSAQPQGSDWPNAYASNVRMIAVRSGERALGEWREEERNVREDFRRYFGKDVRYVDAVAVMTDTDDTGNTGKEATAYYGELYFSTRPTAPAVK